VGRTRAPHVAAVLSCEHASRALPEGVSPGVSDDVLASHVGWDPGALAVAKAIADGTGIPLHAGRWSRLVVDLNRASGSPGAVPASAFGVDVPGNAALSAEERAARLQRFHGPWREELRRSVRRGIEGSGACVHLSVHTFDGSLDARRADLEVGVLFDPARLWGRLVAEELLVSLREAGLEARPNEPYLGTEDGTTTWLRGVFAPDRYAGLELEVRQGLDEAGTAAVVGCVRGWIREVRRVGG
jgi:predicted N-formylglutamate amidohydrolase